MRSDAAIVCAAPRRRASSSGCDGRQSARMMLQTSATIRISSTSTPVPPLFRARFRALEPLATAPQKKLVALGTPLIAPGIANAAGCQLVCDQTIG